MGFIKKYMSLIIPMVILIVSIVFVVLSFMAKSALVEDIGRNSVSKANKLKSALKNTPSERQYLEVKRYQDAYAKDLGQIGETMARSSQRGLLSYRVFPEPKDNSRQLYFDFGDDYRKALEAMLKEVNALDAPTEALISEAMGPLGGTRRSSYGRRSNSEDDSEERIIETICQQRAESISVYANREIFKWYDFWDGYVYPGPDIALEDAWYSQVAYWVYEDVVDTIKEINKGYSRVYDSPVKRILGIDFEKPIDIEKISTKNRQRYGNGDEPKYIFHEDVQGLGVYPWTGRICDENTDVVHFNFAVVVSAKAVLPLIRELCSQKEHEYRQGYQANGELRTAVHNQITVLQTEIRPVIADSELHEYYRYGDDAVTVLTVIGEYIFNRDGFRFDSGDGSRTSIQPKTVIEYLGREDEEGIEKN
jgi:hypothetical protein